MPKGKAIRFNNDDDDDNDFSLNDYQNSKRDTNNKSKSKKEKKKTGKSRKPDIVDLRIEPKSESIDLTESKELLCPINQSLNETSSEERKNVFNIPRSELITEHIQLLQELFSSRFSIEDIKTVYLKSSLNFEVTTDILLNTSNDSVINSSNSTPTPNSISCSNEIEVQTDKNLTIAESNLFNSKINGSKSTEIHLNEIDLWSILPEECKEMILSQLSFKDMSRIAATNQEFAEIVRKKKDATSALILPPGLSSFSYSNLLSGYRNLPSLSFKRIAKQKIDFSHICMAAAGYMPSSITSKKMFHTNSKVNADLGFLNPVDLSSTILFLWDALHTSSVDFLSDMEFLHQCLCHRFLHSNQINREVNFDLVFPFRSLTCVDFRNCQHVTDFDVQTLCDFHYDLREVDFSGCPLLTNSSLYSLSSFGKNRKLPHLFHDQKQKFFISENAATDKMARKNFIRNGTLDGEDCVNDENNSLITSNIQPSSSLASSLSSLSPSSSSSSPSLMSISKSKSILKSSFSPFLPPPFIDGEKEEVVDSKFQERRIKSVTFCDCNITDDCVKEILKENRLDVLDVSKCTRLTHSAFVFPSSLSSASSNLHSLRASNLPHVSKLSIFVSYSSPLTEISFSNCTLLKEANFNIPNLQSLNLSGCKSLRKLSLHSLSLRDLNLSHCVLLSDVSEISSQRLTRVNLFMCRSVPFFVLSHLFTSGKCLEDVDVSGCMRNLEILNVESDSLRTIKASGCNSLIRVCIPSTKLEEIDFSGCDRLNDLSISSSRLRSIILSNCISLSYLRIPFNEIKERNSQNQNPLESKLKIDFNKIDAPSKKKDNYILIDVKGCRNLPDVVTSQLRILSKTKLI